MRRNSKQFTRHDAGPCSKPAGNVPSLGQLHSTLRLRPVKPFTLHCSTKTLPVHHMMTHKSIFFFISCSCCRYVVLYASPPTYLSIHWTSLWLLPQRTLGHQPKRIKRPTSKVQTLEVAIFKREKKVQSGWSIGLRTSLQLPSGLGMQNAGFSLSEKELHGNVRRNTF